jgi:hypothetical protein
MYIYTFSQSPSPFSRSIGEVFSEKSYQVKKIEE